MKHLGWTVTVLFLILMMTVPAQAEKLRKNVLYLNSYHDGYSWSDNILEGVRSVLGPSKYKIEMQIEYMDAKRYKYDYISSILSSLYRDKFKHRKFDLILVSDNVAFNFVMQFGEELFPGVPIVFCGLNYFTVEDANSLGMTGVLENFDARGTLEIARLIHPSKHKVVVIGDDSTTGMAIRHQIESVREDFKGVLDFDFWIADDLSMTLERIRNLPEGAFLFFIPFWKEIEGTVYSAEEMQEVVYNNTDLPIYTSWEFLLGHGALGGKLLSGYEHGREAARLAEKVLDGENPVDIPIVTHTPDPIKFDYNVMQRLGVQEQELPATSIIINVPKAFYELPKQIFWTIIISLLMLMGILMLLVLNIAQRKQAEKKMKEQLSFQEILMNTIPQLVCWKDRKQRYLGANRSFARFYGAEDPTDIVNKSDFNIMPTPEFASWVADLDREVLETNTPRLNVKLHVFNAKGEPVWLEINKVPLLNARGEVVGTLSSADNVTSQVNLERQLRQSQKMEAIGTLAGGIAHDFNNILTSIINSIELALMDLEPETITAKDVERALKAAQRGSGVVKQILAFSRPSQEGMGPTDLHDVLSESLGLLRASFPRNIRVVRNIEKDLGMALADPTQMQQVIMNLCTNSFQALRGVNGAMLEVGLDLFLMNSEEAQFLSVRSGQFLRITIADNGPGIEPDIMEKIFDPFFTTKDKSEGTGLGLAVVHGIVKGHKGGIRVSSVPWKRTAFEIFIPLLDSLAEVGTVQQENVSEGEGRILFVEDDEDQLQTTPRILEEMGYKVTACSSPVEARGLVAANPGHFDLVLTDYDMPEMNGIELAEMLLEKTPEIPLLLVTGRGITDEDAVPFPNIRQILSKPYSRSVLSDAIRRALNIKMN